MQRLPPSFRAALGVAAVTLFALLAYLLFGSLSTPLSAPAPSAQRTTTVLFSPITPYPTVYYPPGMTPLPPDPPRGVTPPSPLPGNAIASPTPRPTAPPPFLRDERVVYAGGPQGVRWSPIGQKVLFYQHALPDGADVFVADLTSKAITLIGRTTSVRPAGLRSDLTFMPAPVWSPDGTEVLFTVAGGNERNDLWVAKADGSGTTKIAESEPQLYLKWLQNGRIPVLRQGMLHSVDRRGQDLRPMSNERIADPLTLNVSPSASRVVQNIGGALVVMNIDGTSKTPLGPALSGFSAWSPDGERLAYLRAEPGNAFESVWAVDQDGKNNVMVSGEEGLPGLNTELAWAPDGRWLAFKHTPTGTGAFARASIYLVKPDGWGLHPIVRSGVNSGLAWAPDGTAAVYVRFGAPDKFPDTNLELVLASLQY